MQNDIRLKEYYEPKPGCLTSIIAVPIDSGGAALLTTLVVVGASAAGGREMGKNIEAALALIVGILILIQPTLLGIIVAIYLIVIGLLGLARNLRR